MNPYPYTTPKLPAMIHYELLPWRRHWWRLPGLVILFVMLKVVEYVYDVQVRIPDERIDRLMNTILNSTLWAAVLMSWLLLRKESRSGHGLQLIMTRLSKRQVFWIKYGVWTIILFIVVNLSSILSFCIWIEIFRPGFLPDNPFSYLFNIFTITDYFLTAVLAPLCVYTYICMFIKSRWTPICIITSGLMAVLIKTGTFYLGLHIFIILRIRYPVFSTLLEHTPPFVSKILGLYGFYVIIYWLCFIIAGLMILYVEKRFRDRVYGEE